MHFIPTSLPRLGIASILALSTVACSDIGTFAVDEVLPTLEIPAFARQIPLSLVVPLPLDLKTQEAYSNGDYDFVSSVQILSMTLLIDPSSDSDQAEDGNLDDFDFISGLEVYLQATIDGAIREELVASIPDGDSQFASGTRRLNLTTTSVDVFDYIEAPDGYKMLVKVTGITPIDIVKVNGNVRYRVGVGFR